MHDNFVRIIVFLFLSSVVMYGNTLRVGIFQPIINSTVPKKDYILGTTVFMKAITEDAGIEVSIVYYDDPRKLGEDFNSKKLDYIASDALTIVQNIPIANLENGIMSFKDSKVDSQTLLIIGLSNDARPMNEKLRGSVVSDGDVCSELYLKTLLLQQSLSLEPNLIRTKNAQQSLLKLFFEKADIALVDRAAYNLAIELNPQMKTKLTVLKIVPLTIGPIGYMRKGIDSDLRAKVISLGKQLNTTNRGKQLLQLFRASTMDDSYTKDLQNIYTLYAHYQTLSQGKKR